NEKTLFVGRKSELHGVEETVRGALRGSSAHMVIVGTYGNGKTTTLKHIQGQFESQLSKALAIYLSNPGESFLDLYRSIMGEIGFERFESIVWKYVETVCGSRDIQSRVVRGQVLFSDLVSRVRPILFSKIRHPDFAIALLKLIMDGTSFDAWRYLCG